MSINIFRFGKVDMDQVSMTEMSIRQLNVYKAGVGF